MPYALLFLVLVVNSDWFQNLWSYICSYSSCLFLCTLAVIILLLSKVVEHIHDNYGLQSMQFTGWFWFQYGNGTKKEAVCVF